MTNKKKKDSCDSITLQTHIFQKQHIFELTMSLQKRPVAVSSWEKQLQTFNAESFLRNTASAATLSAMGIIPQRGPMSPRVSVEESEKIEGSRDTHSDHPGRLRAGHVKRQLSFSLGTGAENH